VGDEERRHQPERRLLSLRRFRFRISLRWRSNRPAPKLAKRQRAADALVGTEAVTGKHAMSPHRADCLLTLMLHTSRYNKRFHRPHGPGISLYIEADVHIESRPVQQGIQRFRCSSHPLRLSLCL
jgi:hypothetical protein